MEGCTSFQLIEGGKIDSTKSILESINKIKCENSLTQIWYRGHSNVKYKLVPSIARKYKYGGKIIDGFNPQRESDILHRFRRRAYPYLGRVPNEWEALFLARHHELPTRILDWTANPLAALYFACSSTENLNKPANVWGIARRKEECDKCGNTHDLDMLRLATLSQSWQIAQKGEEVTPEGLKLKLTRQYKDPLGPFELYQESEDVVKILHPFYNSPRIIAQGGVFTFHPNPKQSLDSYQGKAFLCDRLDIKLLIRWDIQPKVKLEVKEVKRGILKELDSVGINRRTVFPDLDGLAQGLWETEVLWNGSDGVIIEESK